MSPNCECGHERGDHGPKMWGCAYCPCTAYEARPPESTDSFNSGSYTDSFTPEVETRPIITRIDFFGTEYVPKAAWVEAQSSLDAMRLQLDSACQYRDRYKAERDEARDKRFFWENACRRAEGVMVQEAQAKHEALWQLMEATGPVSRETMTEVAVAVARQMNDSHDPYDFKGIARAAITALGRSVEGP